jgi:hypothetical protein
MIAYWLGYGDFSPTLYVVYSITRIIMTMLYEHSECFRRSVRECKGKDPVDKAGQSKLPSGESFPHESGSYV